VLDRGELLLDGPPEELMSAAEDRGDLEHALVAFLERLGR